MLGSPLSLTLTIGRDPTAQFTLFASAVEEPTAGTIQYGRHRRKFKTLRKLHHPILCQEKHTIESHADVLYCGYACLCCLPH